MKLKCLFSIIAILFIANSTPAEEQVKQKKLWDYVLWVDQLVWKGQAKKNIETQISSDEQFVRRIYLDITGTIPTYEQFTSFMLSKKLDKRTQLIKTLLNTPGYVSHMSNFFGDILRDSQEVETYMHHNELSLWIKKQFTNNKPYDKMVYELLMSEGKSTSNGAIGYYMRDWNTGILDTVSATSRSFLGIRIGCAQCHNHVFDKWTQKEFYEFAAFFSGVSPSRTFEEIDVREYRFAKQTIDQTKLKKEEKATLKRISRVSPAVVYYDEKQKLRYPTDYKYQNAKANQTVEPRLIFKFGPQKLKGKNKREEIALWMTSKQNRQFAKVMANRLWKHVFGLGLVEPVDNFRDDVEAINPELLEALTDILIELDFDFKSFLTVLFNTGAYQMAIIEGEENVDLSNYHIQGGVMKKMTARQMWDSFLTLSSGDISSRDELVNQKQVEWYENFKELLLSFREKGSPSFYRIIASNGGMNDEDGNPKDKMPALIKFYEEEWGPIVKEFIKEHGHEPYFQADGEVPDISMMRDSTKK